MLRSKIVHSGGRFLPPPRQLRRSVRRSWVRQADIDDGHAPGVSTSESRRVKDLEQEIRELKRATRS
jgi:transposase